MMDNYDLWNDHEWEKERWLKKRPICRECGEHTAISSAANGTALTA